MFEHFENFIIKNVLFTKQDRLLLAFSGGKDSICLFYLLLKLGYQFETAHCNFQLRGQESLEDELFVLNWCQKHEIKCHVKRFDTAEIAETNKTSIQETARQLRYDWFYELADSEGFNRILTAHHLNDNTETFFINVLRNTGISGLHGIPLRNQLIVRPLMMAESKDIKAFVATHQLPFREDSSNQKNNYLRNHLRNKILPLFENLNPDFNQILNGVTQKVRHFEDLAFELIELKWQNMVTKEHQNIIIPFSELEKIENKLGFLYFNVKSYGFTLEQIENILKLKNDGFFKQIQSKTHQILRERTHFVLKKIEVIDFETLIFSNLDELLNSDVLKCKTADIFEIQVQQQQYFCLDIEKLRFPLQYRLWKQGDKMLMLGMKGQKKISDVLIDKKISNLTKNSIKIIEDSNSSIIFLQNIIISEKVKVEKNTKKILIIEKKSINL